LNSFLESTLGGLLDGYLYPFILQGLALTVAMAAVSLLASSALGMLTAVAKLSGSRVVSFVASLYTTVIRGVPDIVLMFIIFFGGQTTLNGLGFWLQQVTGGVVGWDYLEIDEFMAGVLTLSLIFGAYMGETFRGAILAVPAGQIDAARAFGMSPWQAFRRITLPLSVRHALPGFGNNWLVLVKTTALVSVIGLEDMVFRATQASGTVRRPFAFYFAVAVLYLLLTAVSDVVLRWLNSRYSVGVRRV